jgi:DNA primase
MSQGYGLEEKEPGRYSFRQLKRVVSLDQVLAYYGLTHTLRPVRGELVGPCPLPHHGGDRSNRSAFRAHPRRGVWHCWTHCGGGDVVDLVRLIEACSFAQAARSLVRIAQRCPAQFVSLARSNVQPRPFRPFTRRISLDPRTPFLQQSKRITVATTEYFEAGLAPYSKLLRGTVAVRLHDLAGHPIGYCGRRLDPHDVRRWGKWRLPRALPKREMLYNAHRAQRFRPSGIVVVECAWGVMRLHQAGVPCAVALLGTTLSPVRTTWLARAAEVLLLLDGDEPGRHASEALASELSPTVRVYVHALPDGLDPDDLDDVELRSIVSRYLRVSASACSAPSPSPRTQNTQRAHHDRRP